MKQVLVTGGAGFIGSNLVKMLTLDYGCNVTVLDNMHTGRQQNLQSMGIASQVELLYGNILDRALLAKAIKGKDTVFHLAALDMLSSTVMPRMGLETNIVGTYNVLEEALNAEVEKVVYSSTATVYGNVKDYPIKEKERVNLLNFYAAGKFAGEGYVRVFHEQYGLAVSIVRYANVYGPNENPRNYYAGVVARFIDWALNEQPLLIYGNGGQTGDFIFIRDACRATVLAALDSFGNGGVYNIGIEVETSINQLVDLILKLTGSKSIIKYGPRCSIDNICRQVLDGEKARRELHFVPEWDLTGGLQNTIAWIQKNKNKEKK